MVPLKYAYLALTTMITSPMTIVLPVRLYVRALSHEAYLPTHAILNSVQGQHVETTPYKDNSFNACHMPCKNRTLHKYNTA